MTGTRRAYEAAWRAFNAIYRVMLRSYLSWALFMALVVAAFVLSSIASTIGAALFGLVVGPIRSTWKTLSVVFYVGRHISLSPTRYRKAREIVEKKATRT